jgi:hypothetical protein
MGDVKARTCESMNNELAAEKKGNDVDAIKIPVSWSKGMMLQHERYSLQEAVDKEYSISGSGQGETTGDMVTERYMGTLPGMSSLPDKPLHETMEQNTNTKRPEETVGASYSLGATSDGTIPSSTLDIAAFRPLDSDPTLITSGGDDKRDELSDDDDGARISAPSPAIKFQPLQPLSETKKLPQSTRTLKFHVKARPAPVVTSASIQSTAEDSSHANSAAGSPENGLMNNMVDPVAATATAPPAAAKRSNAVHLSHTPPANVPSSYEASHFGKRPRSGVSKPR